jgi:hypothetical protein
VIRCSQRKIHEVLHHDALNQRIHLPTNQELPAKRQRVRGCKRRQEVQGRWIARFGLILVLLDEADEHAEFDWIDNREGRLSKHLLALLGQLDPLEKE